MKKILKSYQNNQLSLNFNNSNAIIENTISSPTNIETKKEIKEGIVISFSERVNSLKKIKEDQLRKYVIENTKSF